MKSVVVGGDDDDAAEGVAEAEEAGSNEVAIEVAAEMKDDDGEDEFENDGAREESDGACASRLRPNAIEKMLPPIIGESETKPQFSEKCASQQARN